MKNTIILLIGLFLLNCSLTAKNKKEPGNSNSAVEEISIFCSPDLFNITSTWAGQFCSLNPDVNIKVINVKLSSGVENLYISKNLSFISKEYSEMNDGSAWNVVVGREVMVPIFNSKNPFLNEICQQGISPEKLAQIFSDPEKKNWGTLIGNQNKAPVNFYMTDDMSINSGMAELLSVNQSRIEGIKAENDNELISMVQNDPYSIGICKFTSLQDMNINSISENIELLPIDRNGNGKIDHMEKIYDDLNVLSRGVWIGKYPAALFDNIYSVSAVKPKNETEVAFLKWVLSDGQQYLYNYGYSDLLYSERQSKIALLSESELNLITSNENYAGSNIFLIFLGSLALTIFIVVSVSRYMRKKKADISDRASASQQDFDESYVDIPLGLYYDKSHTWAFMEKDGMVKIGINDFLQHTTGHLSRVKMKDTGERIRKGKPVVSIIQNGKQLNIQSPISGIIKEQNKLLNTNSSIINSSPYTDGWIYRIEPTNWIKEIQFLKIGKKYKENIQNEFSRLKEFLSASLNPRVAEYSHVLQDGGALTDGILRDLGPEIWEDFQTNFLEN